MKETNTLHTAFCYSLIVVFGLLFAQRGLAEPLNIRTLAPTSSVIDDEIRLQFVINTLDVKKIELDKTNDFEVLIGPTRSEKRSYEKKGTPQGGTLTVTYLLLPQRAGDFALPRVTITTGKGSVLKSTAQRIKILPADKKNEGQDGSNDVFIQTLTSQTTVFEQEAILLTYKVFTKTSLKSLQGKVPDITGFLIQEIDLPAQKQFEVEHHNGINYRTTIWSQYIIFPQQSGKLEIPGVKFEGVAVRPHQSVDPFEDYLNGNTNFATKKVSVNAPAVTIEVKKLPAAPENYIGAVGRFQIARTQSRPIAAATDEPFSYRLTISGKGNFKMIKSPALNLPPTFDVAEPQITDSVQLTSEGQVGFRTFTYEITPKETGEFILPSTKYAYFDIVDKEYKELTTKEIRIVVAKGSNTGGKQARDTDIRRIKESLTPSASDDCMTYFLLAYVLVWAGAALTYGFLRRKQRGGTAPAAQNMRKALKKAEALAQNNELSACYEAVYETIRRYLEEKGGSKGGDVSDWEKEMTGQGVPDSLIARIKTLISHCQMAKYAPAQSNSPESAKEIIRQTETLLNELDIYYRKSATMKKKTALPLLFFLLFTGITASAATLQQANTLFTEEKYNEAVQQYRQLLNEKDIDKGVVYYNLGNAYYKLNDYPQAILCYRRAYAAYPCDRDLRANMDKAMAKIEGNMSMSTRAFLQFQYEKIVHFFPWERWAAIALVLFVAGVAAFFIYRFCTRRLLVRWAFSASICCFIFSVVINCLFLSQYFYPEAREAVLMTEGVLRAAPNAEDGGFKAVEAGTVVSVSAESEQVSAWREVTLPSGERGWIAADELETVQP